MSDLPHSQDPLKWQSTNATTNKKYKIIREEGTKSVGGSMSKSF